MILFVVGRIYSFSSSGTEKNGRTQLHYALSVMEGSNICKDKSSSSEICEYRRSDKGTVISFDEWCLVNM